MSQEEFEILALHLVQEQSVNISAQVTAGNANTVSRLEMGCAQQSVAVAASTPSEASVDRFQRTVHSAIQNEMFLAPGASQDNCEGWPDNKTPTTAKPAQKIQDLSWDIFISYWVSADKDLVERLYWHLNSLTVLDRGSERKLRVFWDAERLASGEKWEEGFAKAICSTSLVVIVMSRNAYKMEGKRHNVEELTEASRCDKVILEYGLALALNEIKGTAIMPLFVGDKNDGIYSHFFKKGSECMLKICPDVIVETIDNKMRKYLEENAGVIRKLYV